MRQIERKLLKAGIDLAGIHVRTAHELEVAVLEHDGDVDEDATRELAARIGAVLGFGGYRCGYGGWVLSAGYRADPADYGDKSSRHHY